MTPVTTFQHPPTHILFSYILCKARWWELNTAIQIIISLLEPALWTWCWLPSRPKHVVSLTPRLKTSCVRPTFFSHVLSLILSCLVCNCCWFGRVYFSSCLSCTVVTLCVFVELCVYCCFCTLVAGLLAISQYSEGPATGHLDTGFSWFPCVYKQMLRWFPTFQVATTCFSCSPPDLNQ